MQINEAEISLGISAASYPVEAIDAFCRNGFTHFELGVPSKMPEAPFAPGMEAALVEKISAHASRIQENGLKLWSIHLPFGQNWDVAHFEEQKRSATEEQMKTVMDLTARWHPSVYVIHGCLEPVADDQREVRKAHAVKTLTALGAYARSLGSKLALEDLPRSCLANTAAETAEMAHKAGIPICFDVNHLLRDTHSNFLDCLAPEIVTLHLSDYDGIDERHWLPGKGIVPWKMIFDRLQSVGYKGPYLFELRGIYEPEEIRNAFLNALNKTAF